MPKNLSVEIVAPQPTLDNAVAICHRQPAFDDIAGCAVLKYRTSDGNLQINAWHQPVSHLQMQEWRSREFAIIDLGGHKYNKNGFRSAAAFAAHMYVEGGRPLPHFTQDPLTVGEQAVIELANLNNDTGALKVGKSHMLAWLLREVYAVFPDRECEIITEAIEVVNTWIELYEIAITAKSPVQQAEREEAFADYLATGRAYLKTLHPNAYMRFSNFSCEDFSIGQYLAILAYWAQLEGNKNDAVTDLDRAVRFWTDMVEGIKQAKQDAAEARQAKRGLRNITTNDRLMAIIYEVPEDDERISRLVAKELFNEGQMGFRAQAIIMRSKNGVNIRFNARAQTYFDLTSAAEHTFSLLTEERYRENDLWHLQPHTLFILNGGSMTPAPKTRFTTDQITKMVFAGLRKARLEPETDEDVTNAQTAQRGNRR